jgi:adenylylsulfate kinase-like enzyme
MSTVDQKLIIIRGPSGAGKSTVSKGLVDVIRSQGQLCAIIDQDHFLNVIPGNQANCRELCCEMIFQCALACKNLKYDVVLEGILNIVNCSSLFEKLKEIFGQEHVSFYYFDVSLEETQKRHLTRLKANEFTIERMAGWYKSASPTHFENETIISSQSSAADSIKCILEKYRWSDV